MHYRAELNDGTDYGDGSAAVGVRQLTPCDLGKTPPYSPPRVKGKKWKYEDFLGGKKNQVLHFAQSYNLSGHRGGIVPIISLDVLEKMVFLTTLERRLPTDLT